MELDRLYVRILGDIVDLEKKMGKAERLTSDFGQKMTAVGKGLTIGLTVPLAAVGVASVSAAADLDRLKRGLTAVMGSGRAATDEMRRLEGVAKLPGLGFREAIQGSIRLQAAFGDMEGKSDLAREALMAFGNAIATVGGGKAQLDRVTVALSQVAAKGRVSAEEILQLQEALPQIRQAMRDAFGTASTEELAAMGVTAEDFIRRITAEFAKLEQVTGGPANTFENFTGALFRARAEIGNHLLPVVTPLVEGIAAMLEGIEGLNPQTVQWGIALGTVAAMMGPVLILVGQLTVAVAALSVAGASLALVFGIGAPLIIGLGALAGLWIKNRLEAASFRAELERLSSTAGMSPAQIGSELERARANLTETQQRLAALKIDLAGQGGTTVSTERLQAEYNQLMAQMIRQAARVTELQSALARAHAIGGVTSRAPTVVQGGAGGGSVLPRGDFAAAMGFRQGGFTPVPDMGIGGTGSTFRTPPPGSRGDAAFALSMLGGTIGGGAGGALSAAGTFAAFMGTGGLTGAVGMFSAAFQGLSSLFDSGVAKVERIREAFDRLISNLQFEIGFLDIEDQAEQFERLKNALLGGMEGGILEGMIEGLTPENFDEYAEALADFLAQAAASTLSEKEIAMLFGGLSLEQVQAVLAQMEALADGMEGLTDTVNGLNNALNDPSGFKVDLLRFNATQTGSASRISGPPDRGDGGQTFNIQSLTVVAQDPGEFGRKLQRKVARGGFSTVQLALEGA